MGDSTKLPHTWVLWYHDPNSSNYTQSGYIRIALIATALDFWTIVDGISKEAWNSGMFFFMKEGVSPLWEAPENAKGGAWSKRVDAAETNGVFIDCMIHCALGKMLSRNADTIVGVTLSPKGNFHIIKIWNNTTSIADRRLLSETLKMKRGDDIVYKAHMTRNV